MSEPTGGMTTPPDSRRIDSVDLVRGIIMVLMAIDHVRVYSGVPAGGVTPDLFFTRWVTHFCAPGFVFLAGTGAFFHARKLGNRAAIARFLVTRGAILIVLELTLIRFTWTFDPNITSTAFAGVIWMLGWCMVLLSLFVRLQPRTVGWLGSGIMFFQQILALVPRSFPEPLRSAIGIAWEFIYPAGMESLPGVVILYVIVPWIGVMAAGYAFGLILIRDVATRRKLCLGIGLGATLVFVAVAAAITFLVPADGDSSPPAWFRILNQQKYPASQLFLLMTLGPMIALLPFAERARGWLADVLLVFGRVPLFYYLLHIPLIHISALVVMSIRTGGAESEWYALAPFTSIPPEHVWPLPLLYLVWLIDVALLYFPCRWYAALKTRSRSPWLRYV